MKLLVNVAGFQLAWFACVIGASRGEPWVGPVVTLAVLAMHLTLYSARLWEEVAVIVAGSLIGFAVDSVLVLRDILAFPGNTRLGASSALWMVALWANFAATLNVALRWLDGRYALAALLGAVGGPLAYYAGASLNALSLGEPMGASLVAVALVWSLATAALVWFAAQTRKRSSVTGSPAELRP